MEAWGFVVSVLGPVAMGLLLVSLAWAAFERGRIHRRLARLHRGSDTQAAATLEGWRAEHLLGSLLQSVRRGRRIHLVAGAVAGWV